MHKGKKFFFILAGLAAAAAFWFFYAAPAFRGDLAVRGEVYLGPVRVSFYGLLFAGAVLLGYFMASRWAPRFGIARQTVDEALLWIVIFGFVGARTYYVIFDWVRFSADPWEVLQVWHGGLAIYGALIGGIIGVWLFTRRRRLSTWRFLDLLAVILPLGQSIGRWGNFFNQEAFGRPTDLPWRIYVPPQFRPPAYLAEKFFHPAFLYESLWDFLVFLVMLYAMRPRGGEQNRIAQPPGYFAGLYLILYSIGRFFIEPLRQDSFYLGSVKVDQITALVMMLSGAILISLSYAKFQKKTL